MAVEMYFLIDYENVRNAGMQGCEWVEKDDTVAVFYSDAANNMEARYLNSIEKSGCQFRVFKLIKSGKNALDFYIASYLGEVFGRGYRGKAVIVSRDGGFQAVRDFWRKAAGNPKQVLLAPSVEQGILNAEEGSERAANLRKMKQMKSITSFYAGYEERMKLQEALERIFSETEYADRTSEMQDIVANSSTAKILYIDTLRHFGRKDGLEVYRKLKKEYIYNKENTGCKKLSPSIDNA